VENKTPETWHVPKYLYKILSLQHWQASQNTKFVALPAEDEAFIHLAKEDQLDRIIAKFWSDTFQFVVLKLDPEKLEGELVCEANTGGTTRFFHLYRGFIPSTAIVELPYVRDSRKL
jgi:uncharacterized protein (DUF952 family)